MNGKHFYTILLIGFVLFLAQGCKTESPVSPASSVAPILSATWTPTVVVSPSPTVKVPTPTPDLEKRLEEFINIFSYSAGIYRSATAYGVRGLEYLVYLSPQSDQREALINSILNNAFGHWDLLDLDWLLTNYMQDTLVNLVNATGEVSVDLQKEWNMTISDLDADQIPDYLFSKRFVAKTDTTTPSVFYWLHKSPGGYELTEVARFFDTPRLQIISTDDLTQDGKPELAFEAIRCGASTCFTFVFLYCWQKDHWTEIPILPEGWTASNGRWHVEKDAGKSVLIALEGNSAGLSYGDFPAYEIRFEYVNGAFIPVDVREYYPTDPNRNGTTESDFYKILWVDRLTELGFPQRALDILLGQDHWEGRYPDENYLPYVLFRIGMLNLYIRDVNAAQDVWQRIEIESPDSPITSSIPELLQLANQPDPLWKVCHWLKENQITWYPVDFAPNEHPYTDSFPYQWHSMCSDITLVRWQKWVTNRPLGQQAEPLNLTWTLLSEVYDLNQDTIPDPIGRLGEWLWVFLSNDMAYVPVLIGPQVPPQALLFIDTYNAVGTDQYNEINVYQDSLDTSVWLELVGDYQIAKYEWTGDYFKFHPVKGFGSPDSVFAPLPDSNNLLTQALLALFRDQNPAHALELLQTYTSDYEWEMLTARYVTAIALKYNGQADEARLLFEAIITDYPDTGWATFSREHLQTMGDK